MRSAFFLLLLVLAPGLGSCKRMPTAESDLKTLQDFASSGDAAGNMCGDGRHAVDPASQGRILVNQKNCASLPPGDPDIQSCKDIQTTLSSVPQAVQKSFFDLGGSIMATVSANQNCESVFADPASPQYAPDAYRRKIAGCTVFAQGGEFPGLAAGDNRLVMFVKNDTASIRHNLVRMFGFFYAQVVPRLKFNGGKGPMLYDYDVRSVVDSSFTSFQTELANQFLNDMLRLESNPATQLKYKLENITAFIGKNGPEKVRSNKKSGSSDLLAGLDFALDGDVTAGGELTQVRLDRFLATVMAEAFDSMNCTQQIRDETKTSFAASYSNFESIETAIIERARSISFEIANKKPMALAASESDGVAPTDTAGLGLWGGGLLGWLRSVFSGGALSSAGSSGYARSPMMAGSSNPRLRANPSAQDGSVGDDLLVQNIGSCPGGCCCQSQNCPGGCCRCGTCGINGCTGGSCVGRRTG
jgi:hypothetical protein